MSINFQIATLVYLMVQAVLFGVGLIFVLSTSLATSAFTLVPWVVGVSALVSLPLSWMIAPHLRARFGKGSTD